MPSKQHVMRSQIDIHSLIKETLPGKLDDKRRYIIYVNLIDKE